MHAYMLVLVSAMLGSSLPVQGNEVSTTFNNIYDTGQWGKGAEGDHMVWEVGFNAPQDICC